MATNAADPMEHPTDLGTSTVQRKRPRSVLSRDDASNAGSAHSTPRKRSKRAGRWGPQDVRDFVPVGASFSTSVVPIEEGLDSFDDSSEEETNCTTRLSSDDEAHELSEPDRADREKALIEGRRLLIGDLPPDITEEHLKQFFNGYSV